MGSSPSAGTKKVIKLFANLGNIVSDYYKKFVKIRTAKSKTVKTFFVKLKCDYEITSPFLKDNSIELYYMRR